jgi:hypothetical protein
MKNQIIMDISKFSRTRNWFEMEHRVTTSNKPQNEEEKKREQYV